MAAAPRHGLNPGQPSPSSHQWLRTYRNGQERAAVEKRDLYLQRIAAMLVQRGRGHFNDADVSDVAKLAMAGLIQTTDSDVVDVA
jgi:hypothetical protein